MEGSRAFEHLSAATRTTLRCGHGRPKDICGECFPTETKIDRDREFDQTAKTEPSKCFYCDWPSYHGHKIYCPNNSNYSKTPDEFFAAHPNLDSEFTRAKRSETPGPRTVSPSILEFKIQTLEKENRVLTADNTSLAERLRVATERIAGFERMAAGLAAKIDEFERGFKAVTGKAAADFLSDQKAETEAAANGTDLTRCWRPVWSRGEIAACMLDHDHAGDCSADREAAETPMDAPQLNITVDSIPYFEDDEPCGYCHRQPGTQHAANCRQ